jgi:hypothetical protein
MGDGFRLYHLLFHFSIKKYINLFFDVTLKDKFIYIFDLKNQKKVMGDGCLSPNYHFPCLGPSK